MMLVVRFHRYFLQVALWPIYLHVVGTSDSGKDRDKEGSSNNRVAFECFLHKFVQDVIHEHHSRKVVTN